MGRIAPLFIHRSVWERLKNQANTDMELEKVPCKVDIAAMNAQSRKWINSWPDTVQGHVNKATMKKKKLQIAEIAEVEAFRKKKKHHHTAENLRRARDMIFERTGYGKELLSALFESKVLEEREIQIKFKNVIREKEKNIGKAKPKIKNIMYAEFEKGESNKLLLKQKEIADSECNKIMADMKREETIRAAEIEKKNRLEDAEMIEKLSQLQVSEEKQNYCLDKEAVKMFEEDNKAVKEMREKRENLDQVLADVWRKYQDRIRCKEKQVFDHIHKEKHNTAQFMENYELVQRLQLEEEKKYNDFIDKGVKRMERRLQKKEKEENRARYQQRTNKNSQSECVQSKILNDGENRHKSLSSDRQRLFPVARCHKHEYKLLKDTFPPPPRPQFLAPSTKLQDALKQRQTQPGGWSGAAAAHAQFARHAAAALEEATNKHLVRRVIDNYRKHNNLKDLQVPNY